MAKYKKKAKPVRKDTQPIVASAPVVSVSKSQEYSNLVFTQVNELLQSDQTPESIKRYRSLCKRSGGLLRTVGLIQFLTFLAAKASKESEVHHQYLLDHLVTELKQLNILQAKDSEDLLTQVRIQNLPHYMHTTTQVLKLLQWHKRIADILIKEALNERSD